MSAETGMVKVEELRAEVSPVVARAGALVIVTPDDYAAAGEFCKEIARALKRVGDVCDPAVRATDAAHTAALALRASFADPLKAAKATVIGKQMTWNAEKERIRKAEEDRLNAIEQERQRRERERQEAAARLAWEKAETARRAEEEARRQAQAATDATAREAALKEAERYRAASEAAKAKAEAKEDAAANAPPPLTIHVSSVMPKVKGQVTRHVWKARITDPKAAVAAAMTWPDWQAYVHIDQQAFNGFASRTKGAVSIPGVEVYEELQMATSGGR